MRSAGDIRNLQQEQHGAKQKKKKNRTEGGKECTSTRCKKKQTFPCLCLKTPRLRQVRSELRLDVALM